MKPSLSIGIEEEYQTIDPETRDLRSHIGMEMIAKGRAVLTERVKPEMHQSVIEARLAGCATSRITTPERWARPFTADPGRTCLSAAPSGSSTGSG